MTMNEGENAMRTGIGPGSTQPMVDATGEGISGIGDGISKQDGIAEG